MNAVLPASLAKRAAFLEALATTCSVAASARLADLARSTVYEWRGNDEAFAAAWDAALELGIDALEDEVMRRAKDGVEKFVVSAGRVVTDPETGRPLVEHAYSDSLAMFLLRGRRPERYRERASIDLTVTEGLAARLEVARKRMTGPAV